MHCVASSKQLELENGRFFRANSRMLMIGIEAIANIHNCVTYALMFLVQVQIMLDVNYRYLMNMCNDYYKHIYDRNYANTSSKIYCFVNTHGCNIINDGTY